jgi:hypothetical protein
MALTLPHLFAVHPRSYLRSGPRSQPIALSAPSRPTFEQFYLVDSTREMKQEMRRDMDRCFHKVDKRLTNADQRVRVLEAEVDVVHDS